MFCLFNTVNKKILIKNSTEIKNYEIKNKVSM